MTTSSTSRPAWAGTNVSTSGTTVTWVSGTNFANVTNGQFVIVNSGQEFQVSAINGGTLLTVGTTLQTLTNVPVLIGTGDLLSIVASSYSTTAHNTVIGGATDGIALSSGANSEVAQQNLIQGNQVLNSGEICIGVSEVTSNLQDNSIIGNLLTNCGQSFAADGGGNADAAIVVSGASVSNTFIDSNYIRDDQGSPTITNWLNVGSDIVIVGKNGYRGTINAGVKGDVSSISLSAGWGSTASVAVIVSEGDEVSFTITSNGTGQAANPTATINKITAVLAGPPIVECKGVSGTAPGERDLCRKQQ